MMPQVSMHSTPSFFHLSLINPDNMKSTELLIEFRSKNEMEPFSDH